MTTIEKNVSAKMFVDELVSQVQSFNCSRFDGHRIDYTIENINGEVTARLFLAKSGSRRGQVTVYHNGTPGYKQITESIEFFKLVISGAVVVARV